MLAGNALALEHIRAGVHGDLEHLLMAAVTPTEAMEILKTHCETELSRMHTVFIKRFHRIKMDLSQGPQVFLALFSELEGNLRSVRLDLPDAYKKTVLIDALPDCMETDRAALGRMSATLTLRALKAEVLIAVDQYLRRNSPDMKSGTSGSSTQGSTPVQALSADH